jgi:two-component system, NarL family, invasion response regulator UvrY
MSRILVVDDQPVVREGVRQILGAALDAEIIEVDNGEEALLRMRGESWDLVLLELKLPRRSGFEVLFELKDVVPRLPILIFSSHEEEAYVVRALKAGACGYVTKTCQPRELVRAAQRVATGHRYVMAELADVLIPAFQSDERPPHERLSDREYEVFCFVARGLSLREIALHLNIAESTVSTYRTRILEKMHVANNAEITRYALDNGLYEA